MPPLDERKNERENILASIISSVRSKKPMSIYISGAPGTGKTATVKYVQEALKKEQKNLKITTSFINCVSLIDSKNPRDEIILGMGLKPCAGTGKPVNQMDLAALAKRAGTRLLVLDEIDSLLKKNGTLLCSIFQWPIKFPGKLIVIGIANTLDLTARLLPKLRTGIQPKLIIFNPYTTAQLFEILKRYLSKDDFIDMKAIELCARKVSSLTGDVRKAFNFADELVAVMRTEDEVENENVVIDLSNNCDIKQVTPKKKRGIKRPLESEINNINVTPKKSACMELLSSIRKAYSSPCQRRQLPFQQRIVLATLLRLMPASSLPTADSSPSRYMLSNNKNKVSKHRVFEAYFKVCELLSLPPMEAEELEESYSSLASQSMIRLDGQYITFLANPEKARSAINDNGLISEIATLEF